MSDDNINRHDDEPTVAGEGEMEREAQTDEPLGQEMSPEQLAEAQRYGRQQLALGLTDKAIDVVYLSAFALLAAPPLDAWLAGPIGSPWLRLAAMFAIAIGLHELISLPLSFFAGYVLEHRYGLSNQSAGAWLRRHAKQFALAFAFGLAVFYGLYALIWFTGPWWWLLAAAAFFVVSIVLGQLAPVLIMPLFYKIERLEDRPELNERMAKLAEGTGLTIEGVYRLGMSDETNKANAMLAGLGRTRRVLLGDTLLDRFTPDEIEVIFAHEIGHHVHRHIGKMIAAGIVYSLAGFWLCDALLLRWVAAVEGAPVPYSELPVYTLPLVMLALTLFGLVIEPVQNIISRRFERQCDRYALQRTGLREAYLSAFRKLAVLNKDDPAPNRLAVFLFHSHPPISERLALADSA